MLKRAVISLTHILYFAKQYPPLVNDSNISSVLTVNTEPFLESFHFSAEHVGDIIKQLDLNKANKHDMISIRMLKLYGNSTWRPLQIIFKKCLKEGILPAEGKKVNVIPIQNKKR